MGVPPRAEKGKSDVGGQKRIPPRSDSNENGVGGNMGEPLRPEIVKNDVGGMYGVWLMGQEAEMAAVLSEQICRLSVCFLPACPG